MAVDVGETLLQDAKESELHVAVEPAESGGSFKLCFYATALGKAIEIPGDGCFQSHFLEHGRVEEVGNGAHFLDGFAHELRTLFELVCIAVIVTHGCVAKGIEAHFQDGKILAEAIVEIAADLTALFILSTKQVQR